MDNIQGGQTGGIFAQRVIIYFGQFFSEITNYTFLGYFFHG
jgi:hypothetical protein